MSSSSQTSTEHGNSITRGPKVKNTSFVGKSQRPPSRHLHVSPEFYFDFTCERIAKKASIKQLQPIPEAKGSEDDESPPYNWHANYFEKEEALEASEAYKARKKEENEDDAKCTATLKSGYKLVNGKGGSRKCSQTRRCVYVSA
jgi:hypothetical protein